jgi:hypothetical protein
VRYSVCFVSKLFASRRLTCLHVDSLPPVPRTKPTVSATMEDGAGMTIT